MSGCNMLQPAEKRSPNERPSIGAGHGFELKSALSAVCSSIKKLFEYGGVAEMDGIITELKIKYPRRPALIKELNALTVKIFDCFYFYLYKILG